MAKVTTDKCPYTGRILTRPSLKLIGAKTKQRAFLYQYFPQYYTEYHEVFLGTGGLLLEEPRGVPRVGYDINKDVVDYYKIMRDSPEVFWSILSYEIDMVNRHNLAYPEEQSKIIGKMFFEDYWKRGYKNHFANKHWKSMYFYMITKTCMNGIWRKNKSGEVNSSYCKTIRGRGLFDSDWFYRVSGLIQNTAFRHCDFNYAFAQIWNSADPGAFIFLDPPYRYQSIKNKKGCVTVYNAEKFVDEQHLRLRDLLAATPNKWLMTINDDDWIREIYKDFDIVSRSQYYSCSNTKNGRSERPELLIANYPISHIELKVANGKLPKVNTKADNEVLDKGSD